MHDFVHCAFVLAVCTALLFPRAVMAEGFGTFWSANGNPSWGDEGRAAPASIASDIPIVYEDHWDVPSRSGNPALIGPVQFLRRAVINEDDGTVTMPLYQGHNADGTTVWYVLTDTTNKEIAEQMGLIFSAKLRYADKFGAVRSATLDQNAAFVFEAGVIDFSPVRRLVPGSPTPLPATSYSPGSVADAYYSPVVRTPDNVYYNAPVIAFNVSAAVLQRWAGGNPDYSVVHDKVVAINPANFSVVLKMTVGFSFSKPIFYLSTDASDPFVATLESSTWAPALVGVNQTTRDIDSIPGQGNERLGLVVNGPVNPFPGTVHPYRQGVYSAIDGQGDPLNVSHTHNDLSFDLLCHAVRLPTCLVLLCLFQIFGGIPTVNLDYSPLWDVEMIEWTQPAITSGYVTRITSFLPDLFSFQAKGLIQAYGGGSIRRSGLIINCPTLARLV